MHAERSTLNAARLHELYLDDVFRYVSRRVPRRDEAEDVTAEVFAAAFQQLGGFRADCEPRLWLMGIARRKVADSLRKRSRRRETLECDLPPGSMEAKRDDERNIVPSVADTEDSRRLREIVAALRDDQREALLLHYVEGLKIAEVADVMRRSPAAVNSLLQRARAAAFRRGEAHFLGCDGEVDHGRA